ncbi:TolC family protein [candidate division KSB1 bacterium]|nr:TolC family protein [candidate division KSB1 bacterium]
MMNFKNLIFRLIVISIFLLNMLGGFFPIRCVFAAGETNLTLNQAISQALRKNNQVRMSEFGLRKARWDRGHAWSLMFPGLSVNSRFMRIDDRTFAERDFRRYLPPEIRDQIPQTVFQESYFTSLDVNIPLFNGAILNGLFMANSNVDMASHLNESTRNQIVFQVVSTYLNVLKSQEVVALQQEYLELSKLNFEKAERLEQSGRYSKAEALRWKVDYEQQRSLVVSSESNLRSALTVLKRLLNLDMNVPVKLESTLPDYLMNKSENLAQLSSSEVLQLIQLSDEQLVEANAALGASRSSANISKLLYRNSYTAFLPNVSVSYSHSWRENNTLALDDYSPKTWMINLTMPLFTSFQNVTSSQSAYYDYKQSQEQFTDQLLNLRYILTETANKIINLKTQRELAKTTVDLSERNYRVISQQKEKGLVSNIDFIDAKLNFQNARLNQINTHYDFISAMVELNYLLGKINTLIQ